MTREQWTAEDDRRFQQWMADPNTLAQPSDQQTLGPPPGRLTSRSDEDGWRCSAAR